MKSVKWEPCSSMWTDGWLERVFYSYILNFQDYEFYIFLTSSVKLIAESYKQQFH